MSGNIGWDDEIVLRKRAEHTKVTRSSADINAARRAGAVVSTERKAVTNAGHVGEDFRRIAKLAETDEIVAPKAVSMDVGKAIAKARIELKMNQKELGVKVNEKQTVVSTIRHCQSRTIAYDRDRIMALRNQAQLLKDDQAFTQLGLALKDSLDE
ncbi:multiprotein-bridging factor 1, partial [Lobosporangium transversale]